MTLLDMWHAYRAFQTLHIQFVQYEVVLDVARSNTTLDKKKWSKLFHETDAMYYQMKNLETHWLAVVQEFQSITKD